MLRKSLIVSAVSLIVIGGFVAATAPAFAASREQVLYSFHGSDGSLPYSGSLIFDQRGNLYGTTVNGGAYSGGACSDGCGTVFKLSPAANGKWSETVLYRFCTEGGPVCPDGALPYGGLIFDSAGNLYGTTELGGTYTLGTVFELTRGAKGKWTEAVLHSFGAGFDGAAPEAGVVMDAAGNLYGTTPSGGTDWSGCEGPCGTVFGLQRGENGQWTYQVLHNFTDNGTDGFWPYAGLIVDGSGNLYGTTEAGGPSGFGTVFELTPQGVETILYSFDYNDGSGVLSNVILGAKGNLYGMTTWGGAFQNGTIFELIPGREGWTQKTLHSFHQYRSPDSGLILDASGNLYGTTQAGGYYHSENDCYDMFLGACAGTAFELKPGADGEWIETALYSFGRAGDGRAPTGSLVFDAAGNLYGTTVIGGTGQCTKIGCGTVFEITP